MSNFWKVFVAVIITLIIAGGGGWYGANYFADKKLSDKDDQIASTQKALDATNAKLKTATATTSTTKTIDATADWKTYTNSTYGFSFKYPSDWTLKTGSADSLLSINLSSAINEVNGKCRTSGCDLPNTMLLNVFSNITALDTQSTSIKGYLDKKAALADPVYTSVTATTIGNISGYQAKMGPNQIGGGRIFYADLADGKVMNAWFYEADSDAGANITDQIISTFQFTK